MRLSTGRMPKIQSTYEPADMKTTGFSGNSFYGNLSDAKARKNINLRRFEENGKCIVIDQE